MNGEPGAILVALQHADGLFPSGGFAFSQGLEASACLSDRLGPFDLAAFMECQIRHRWAGFDRIALVRAHRLGSDLQAVARLDAEVEASSLVEGLRSGSRRNGAAFLAAHERLATPGAADYRGMIRSGAAQGHLAVVQGLAWRALGIGETLAAAMGGYQAAASIASAAVRLGLTGAIDAQARIAAVLPLVGRICAEPAGDEEPLSSFVPLAEIAVCLHGVSGQRLFSN